MFTGVEGIKELLTGAYGSYEVSVANAAMRWVVHHSQLDPRYGGSIADVRLSLEEQWLRKPVLIPIAMLMICLGFLVDTMSHVKWLVRLSIYIRVLIFLFEFWSILTTAEHCGYVTGQ